MHAVEHRPANSAPLSAYQMPLQETDRHQRRRGEVTRSIMPH
jgi:hypothetical protein